MPIPMLLRSYEALLGLVVANQRLIEEREQLHALLGEAVQPYEDDESEDDSEED